MNKTIKRIISTVLVISTLCTLIACSKTNATPTLWDSAAYVENTTLGNGENTLVVEVKAEEKSVTFTVYTDEDTVGEALLEHQLIDGENSDYGLYVKVVNGITADYDVDQSYWAFYIDGEYASTGVDSTMITEGSTYQLEYTK